jgi:hypothetical protein
MPARPGDRTGLIFGGFKADTDRADIEDCLRKIMLNVDGVERKSRPSESSQLQAM